ncbi:hypothetical protein DFH28DRAFT_488008 [Melampsora americana]|nr:hypothetical protein DFH28DRAFT_488008 [Melampsora americana]
MPVGFISPAQANSNEYFVRCTSGANLGPWLCKLCTGRTFVDRIRHSKLKTHIDRVRLDRERRSSVMVPPGLGSRAAEDPSVDEHQHPPEFIPEDTGVPDVPSPIGDDINTNDLFDEDMGESSDELESLYGLSPPEDVDFPGSRESSVDLDDILDAMSDSESSSSGPEHEQSVITETWLPWYPLRKKEHAAALLMLGTGRNLMSTAEYTRIRCILKNVLQVFLPDLGHVKKIRTELKSRLGLRVLERTSPLGNPCFTLSITDIISQELSNPEVCQNIGFLPEIDKSVEVNRFSQSKKWREELQPTLRVPMVEVDGEHFYIYEPAQLVDSVVVLPVFFYKDQVSVRAKCLKVVADPQGGPNFCVAAEPKFDSEIFLDVDVQTFACSFARIELQNGLKWRDCPGTQLLQESPRGLKCIELPNRWREKANGLIIRSVPLVLYSDDTSGNVSKKWNKHMSFYFTLAGLTPKLTNQEYHIHPLCTSNIANALEQGDQIVDELNHTSSTGFQAYDCSLQRNVLVVPFILCHTGDSPMHAEISNTTNPSGTLSPCRVCDLTVESRADKQTETYVQKFVGIDTNWMAASLPFRNWNRTRENTKKLWALTRNPKSIKQFDDLSKQLGTRDSMNLPFAKEVQQIYRSNKHKPKSEQTSQLDIIRHCAHLEGKFGEHMFNPFLRLAAFDGHLDTPVETLHVVLLGVTKYLYRDVVSRLSPNELDNLVGRWQGFKIDGLNVPPIQACNMVHHAQSLLGKDFRIVLQAAPFVFFEFLPDEYRHCWILLVHLASLVFQTRIFNMGVYLSELKIVVARFLKQLVALNAQWTNKPKFHMLTHLPYCVERFGPPSLFATEKMESQNGVTRIASVHSNRHSPGKDIANRFNDERLLRMLISGSSFYDRQIRTRATASSLLRKLFQEKEIRRGLGLNQLGTYTSDKTPQITYPKNTPHSQNVVDCDDPPRELARKWPNVQWKKVLQVGLENGQKVLKGTFVLVDFKKEAGSPICVGQVGGIWEQVGSKTVLVQVRKCRLAPGLEPFYGMKEIKVSSAEAWVRTQNVTCVLNAQHNCHDAKCDVTNTKSYRIERTQSQKKHAEVTHKDTNSFIINAGSHYYSEFHRYVTAAVWDPVTAAEWKDSIQEGLSVWYQCCPPKDHEMDAEDQGQPQDDDPLDINM